MRANTPSGTAEPPDRHPDQPDTLPTLNDHISGPGGRSRAPPT